VYALIERNNINNAHRIYVGQVLEIAGTGSEPARRGIQKAPAGEIVVAKRGEAEAAPAKKKKPVPPPIPESATREPSADTRRETGLGDRAPITPPVPQESYVTLPEAAKDVALLEAQLPSDDLAVEFAVAVPEPEGQWTEVLPDETLGHFADWLEIRTQQLRNLNRIKWGQDIRIHQKLRLTFKNVSPEEFHRRRVEYHKSIREDFFANYAIDGVTYHKVRRGENICYLANYVYEIPHWLLEYYNPNRDLSKLHPGNVLIIPDVAARSGETDAPGTQ
jgi:membrane-bound lytic murein transglycosylase D